VDNGAHIVWGSRGREFKSRQPDGKGPGGGDLLDCMKAPKTLNGHRFRTFRTLRFRTRGRLMENCRCRWCMRAAARLEAVRERRVRQPGAGPTHPIAQGPAPPG